MTVSRVRPLVALFFAFALSPVACSSGDDAGSGSGSGGSGQRGPLGKADNVGQCVAAGKSYCGTQSAGTCWCDSQCATFGDCCADQASACGSGADCTATFHWLQKDAYKDTAGRSSDLWPPHTTTTLEIVCDGVAVRSESRENHGTKPGAKDANGEIILVDVLQKQVTGPRAELEAMADAYKSCECGNSFLSLNGLDDPKVQSLVKKLSDYMLQNLTCSGATDTAGLVDLITKGDVPGALAVLPSCSWTSGADFETGFDAALKELLAASNEELAAYHVCNNDAQLQAALFEGYATAKTVASCDGASALCAGPAWLYKPTP
ncbi:MAG: hypothetical protein IPI67_39700 [Myxococcales bacterium]|nr:hypothetical protein [Myxococcales bacterium]